MLVRVKSTVKRNSNKDRIECRNELRLKLSLKTIRIWGQLIKRPDRIQQCGGIFSQTHILHSSYSLLSIDNHTMSKAIPRMSGFGN